MASGGAAGENVPLVRISKAQTTNKFTNKAEVAMPLGDGGSYFFLCNIIAGASAGRSVHHECAARYRLWLPAARESSKTLFLSRTPPFSASFEVFEADSLGIPPYPGPGMLALPLAYQVSWQSPTAGHGVACRAPRFPRTRRLAYSRARPIASVARDKVPEYADSSFGLSFSCARPTGWPTCQRAWDVPLDYTTDASSLGSSPLRSTARGLGGEHNVYDAFHGAHSPLCSICDKGCSALQGVLT